MNKKKILSLIMALVMLVGVFSPLSALAADVAAPEGTVDDSKLSDKLPTETTVNVYKLQAEEYFKPQQWDHNGGKLSPEQLKTLGKEVKGLKGVEFSYYTVTAAQLEKLKAAKPATAEAVKTALGESFTQQPTKLALTDKDGMATKKLPNGNYWFIETYTPADVTTNGAHAIPFALTLPQVQLVKNNEGKFEAANPTKYLTELNIYPKNTTTKPKVDKDFEGKANANRDITEPKTDKRDYTLGDDVPYEIQTIIPANTKYGSVYWTDQMTEGLTFKEDTLEVKIGETKLVKDTDYKVTVDGNGFKLELIEAGLKKVEDKENDVKITVTYKATLNEKSVVNIPESNDVIFHYGNKPGKGNTPIPNKPEKGKIEVEKTWNEGTGTSAPKELDGKPVKDFVVKVQLINANTGKVVEKYKDVELNEGNQYKTTFEDLDDKMQYKVIEKSISYKINTAEKGKAENWVDVKEGFEVEYGKATGKLTLKNYKSENPEPLNPHEPKVVHYGKRFVKADKGTDKSLEGAQFVIKAGKFTNVKNEDKGHLESQEGKYLARKSAEQTNADRAAYLEARARYEDMFKEGSGKTQTEANTWYETNVKPKFEALNTKYEWKKLNNEPTADTVKNDNLVVLESDKAGRFAIDGLPEGEYELVEIKAPEGYALPTNTFKFTVSPTSFNEEGDVKYEAEDKEVTVSKGTTAKRIDNSNLTIPQTGGMGTVLFTVVGISLMAGAVIAMKKNREEA